MAKVVQEGQKGVILGRLMRLSVVAWQKRAWDLAAVVGSQNNRVELPVKVIFKKKNIYIKPNPWYWQSTVLDG